MRSSRCSNACCQISCYREKGKLALRARAYERSAQLLGAAREVGAASDPAALVQAELELKAAREEIGR
jgi:hypothetical protein